MRCRFYSTCVKFCLANRDYNSKLILYTPEIKHPFLREPVLLVKSFPEDETQVALLSPLLSLQLLTVYGFSNKCCLQTCITRRNIRKWLFMNELIDSTADGLSVWCIRPLTRSRPMFSQRKVMCAWVCLCEVPQHARGAFTRAKTLLWLQNDKSMQGIFSTNGKNCPHPPPPFPELTLGAAKVRSDAHTTCNHLPQCVEQWFSKRLRSRLFCTQAPTRTDTNTQKIKTQRGKEDGVYMAIYIYIEEVGVETVPSEQVHLSYGGYREENRREQLNWDKSRQMLQVEWGGNVNVCPLKSGNHSFTAYQREKWENV